jgi:hypothetical protein
MSGYCPADRQKFVRRVCGSRGPPSPFNVNCFTLGKIFQDIFKQILFIVVGKSKTTLCKGRYSPRITNVPVALLTPEFLRQLGLSPPVKAK